MKDFGIDKNIFKEIGFHQGTSTHKDRVDTIKQIYEETKIIIDTHTADAVAVAKKHKTNDGIPMVAMQTALAVKFEHSIKEALGFIPKREERFIGIEKNVNSQSFYNIDPDANKLKEYIRNNINSNQLI